MFPSLIRDMVTPDGPLNVPEYGGLDTAEGFQNLQEISAYYHVKDGGHYTAVLLTTGMNDPRVVPWEPVKMAARLQAATGVGNRCCCAWSIKAGMAGLAGRDRKARSGLRINGASCFGNSVSRSFNPQNDVRS